LFMALDTSIISLIDLRLSSLIMGHARITNVSPSSVTAKIFPFYDHGVAEKVPESTAMRCRP